MCRPQSVSTLAGPGPAEAVRKVGCIINVPAGLQDSWHESRGCSWLGGHAARCSHSPRWSAGAGRGIVLAFRWDVIDADRITPRGVTRRTVIDCNIRRQLLRAAPQTADRAALRNIYLTPRMSTIKYRGLNQEHRYLSATGK